MCVELPSLLQVLVLKHAWRHHRIDSWCYSDAVELVIRPRDYFLRIHSKSFLLAQLPEESNFCKRHFDVSVVVVIIFYEPSSASSFPSLLSRACCIESSFCIVHLKFLVVITDLNGLKSGSDSLGRLQPGFHRKLAALRGCTSFCSLNAYRSRA